MATNLYLSWWFHIEGESYKLQKVNLSKAKKQIHEVCNEIIDITSCPKVQSKHASAHGWILEDILEHEPEEHWDRDEKVQKATDSFRRAIETNGESVIGSNSTIGKVALELLETPSDTHGLRFYEYLETFVFSSNMTGTIAFLKDLAHPALTAEKLEEFEAHAMRIVGESGRGGSMMILKQAGHLLNGDGQLGAGAPVQDEEIVHKFLKLKDEVARKLFARIRVLWKIPNANGYMEVMNKILALDSYLNMMACMSKVKSDLMVPVAYSRRRFEREGIEKLPQNFRDDLLIWTKGGGDDDGGNQLFWFEPLKAGKGIGKPTALYEDQARLLVRQGVTLAAVPPQQMKQTDEDGNEVTITRNGYYLVNLQGLRKDSPFTDVG